MKCKSIFSWGKFKSITLLIIFALSLTACTQTTSNIDPNQAIISADDAAEHDSDYYTIAYANMVNLDAAVIHKNSDVIYLVSNIQILYGEYEKALETVNRGLEFSDEMKLFTNKVNLLERFGDLETRDVLVNQVLSKQENNYKEMSLDDKLSYNLLLSETPISIISR